MRDNQIETYTNKHIEKINELNGSRLNDYIIGVIEEMAENEFITLEEGNVLDVSDDYLKLEVLESIYDNIVREEDKVLFAQAISNNASLLGLKISEEFTSKLPKNNQSEDTSTETEPEEEQELEEPNKNNGNDNNSDSTENNNSEIEEDLEKEGEAIKEYKEKTAELESELEALEAKYNNLLNETLSTSDNGIELKEKYEKLKKKIELVELNPEDNMYPEFETDKKLLEELEEQIKNLPENKSAKLKEEYEKLKKKIELVELNPEDLMYPEFEADKRRLEEL